MPSQTLTLPSSAYVYTRASGWIDWDPTGDTGPQVDAAFERSTQLRIRTLRMIGRGASGSRNLLLQFTFGPTSSTDPEPRLNADFESAGTFTLGVSGGTLEFDASDTTYFNDGNRYQIVVESQAAYDLWDDAREGARGVSLTLFLPDIPDAAPPTVTIDSIAAGDEGTSVGLSASVAGGTYDSIAYSWTADEGTLSGETTATPTWTRPQVSSTKNVTLRLTVTVRGTGTNARAGTSATRSATRAASVRNLLPVAVAPSASINAIAAGDEGASVGLSASVTGGRYDSIAYAWTADQGTLSGADTATPTWTRPQVSSGQNVTLRLTVTARGTGTTARSGTSATRTATRAAAVVNVTTDTDTIRILSIAKPTRPTGGTNAENHLPTGWTRGALDPTGARGVWESTRTRTFGNNTFRSAGVWSDPSQAEQGQGATAPSLSIDAIGAADEGTTVNVSASVSGGRYDTLTYAWSAEGGTFSSTSAVSPRWTRPAVDADSDFDVRLTVTARGTGTNARAGTSATRSATRTARVLNKPEIYMGEDPIIAVRYGTTPMVAVYVGDTRVL